MTSSNSRDDNEGSQFSGMPEQKANPDRKQDPLVSVVIPTFNRERLLIETIDSCFNQTYPHLEVVVIDDGSTDGTAETLGRMAAELPPGRVRHVTQPNQGPAAACNAGIELARGVYLKFLGSDDTMNIDAIEHYVRAIQATGADLCIGSRQFMTASGRFWQNRLEYQAPEGLIEDPLTKYFNVELRPQTGFWLLHRDVFRDGIRFDTTLLAREDTDLLARILVRGATVAGAPKAVLNTRCHPGERQGQRQYEPEVFSAVVDSNVRLYELMRSHGRLEDAGSAFAGFLNRMVVRGWNIDRPTAQRCYALARKVHRKPELVLSPTWSHRERRIAGFAWNIGGPGLCARLLAVHSWIRDRKKRRRQRVQQRKKNAAARRS